MTAPTPRTDHQASRKEWQGPTNTTREPIPLTDHQSLHAQNQRLREQLAGSERARSFLVHDLDAAHRIIREQSVELVRHRLMARMRTPGYLVPLCYVALLLGRLQGAWDRLWRVVTGPDRHEHTAGWLFWLVVVACCVALYVRLGV